MHSVRFIASASLVLVAANPVFAAISDVKPLPGSATASKLTTKSENENLVPYQRDLLAPTNLAYGPQATHYQIEIDVGTRSEVKLFFKAITLPQGARLEVSRADGSQLRVYGWADFQGGAGFSPFSLDAERVRVRVVYPSHVARGHNDAVVVSHYKQTSIATTKAMNGVDERENAYCVKAHEPYMYQRSLSLAAIGATGWLYGSGNHVITNRHVIASDADLRNGELKFAYQKHRACGGAAGGDAIVYSESPNDDVVLVRPGYVVTTGDIDINDGDGGIEKDYTVYTINDFDYRNARIKKLFGGLSIDPNKANLGHPLYVPQHGQSNGGVKTIAYLRQGRLCDANKFPGGLIITGCQTEPGSSGSPMISRASHKVIGLTAINNGSFIDPDFISGGPSSFELWHGIKDHVPVGSNVEVRGEGNVVGGAIDFLGLPGPSSARVLKTIPSGLSFEELSGELVHMSNYSRLTVEAEDIDHGGVFDLTFRLQLATPCGTAVALNQTASCTRPGTSGLWVAVDDAPNIHPWTRRTGRGWIGLTTRRPDGSLAYHLMVNATATQ